MFVYHFFQFFGSVISLILLLHQAITTRAITKFTAIIATANFVLSSIDYDMNITRGLMSSLEKKGIIYIGDNDIGGAGQPMTWVEII